MPLDIHPWEKAGLGKAPFRFVGVSEKTYVACPGAPAVPAGTCDYCGNGILYCYGIESADGKHFVVGCECVRKLDKNALVNATEFDRARLKLERDKRAAKRTIVHAREKARIDAALALLDRPDVDAAVAAMPHPFAAMAKDGKAGTCGMSLACLKANTPTTGLTCSVPVYLAAFDAAAANVAKSVRGFGIY